MEFLIKEYIKKLTEEDIYNFAQKEGITLSSEELNTIYFYIKNYADIFIKEDATFLFEEIKEKLKPETYNKIIELYNKYKKYIPNK